MKLHEYEAKLEQLDLVAQAVLAAEAEMREGYYVPEDLDDDARNWEDRIVAMSQQITPQFVLTAIEDFKALPVPTGMGETEQQRNLLELMYAETRIGFLMNVPGYSATLYNAMVDRVPSRMSTEQVAEHVHQIRPIQLLLEALPSLAKPGDDSDVKFVEMALRYRDVVSQRIDKLEAFLKQP